MPKTRAKPLQPRCACIDIESFVWMPRSKKLPFKSLVLCRDVIETAELMERPKTATDDHKITCAACRANPLYQNAFVSARDDFAPRLWSAELRFVSYVLDTSFVDDDFFAKVLAQVKPVLGLPLRVFVHVMSRSEIRINLEAFGTRQEGDANVYYNLLSKIDLPFPLSRFGEEASRNFSRGSRVDLATGEETFFCEIEGKRYLLETALDQ